MNVLLGVADPGVPEGPAEVADRRAQLAEQSLGEIRVAIRNGLLSGEEAEHALQEAEREVTRAQASLADAEAAEEHALNEAMNAEAEAEVAEGMAYAAVDRTGPLLEGEQEQGDREEATWEVFQSYPSQEVADSEPDITLNFSRGDTGDRVNATYVCEKGPSRSTAHRYEEEIARRWQALPLHMYLPLSNGESCQLLHAGRPGGSLGPDVRDAVLYFTSRRAATPFSNEKQPAGQ